MALFAKCGGRSQLTFFATNGGLCGEIPLIQAFLARLGELSPEQMRVLCVALSGSRTAAIAIIEVRFAETRSLRWRHRFLEAPREDKAERLCDIVEVDETFFLESFKGGRGLPRPPRKLGGRADKRGLSAEQIPVLVVPDRRGACPRGLRHSFGVGTLQAGVPITLLQRWLVHARLSTTEIYANVIGPEEISFATRFWAWST